MLRSNGRQYERVTERRIGFGGGAEAVAACGEVRKLDVTTNAVSQKAVYASQRKPIWVYENAEASKGRGWILRI